MTIDERLSQKENEMRKNHDLIRENSSMKVKLPSEPIHFNTPVDKLKFDIYTDIEKLLELEHKLLLNEKYPTKMRLDVDKINKDIEEIRAKIDKTEEILKARLK